MPVGKFRLPKPPKAPAPYLSQKGRRAKSIEGIRGELMERAEELKKEREKKHPRPKVRKPRGYAGGRSGGVT